MKRFIFFSAIVLTAILIFLATRRESPPEPPVEHIEYLGEETTQASGGRTTSNYEKTPSYYEVQYPSELPPTGGIEVW